MYRSAASGTAIAKRRGKTCGKSGCSKVMLELAGGNVEAITSEIVGRAYAAGDPLSKEILLETVELLAIWLGNIVDLLEPDVVILGGGVATMLSPFFGEIRNRLPAWCVNARCWRSRWWRRATGRMLESQGVAHSVPLPCQLVRATADRTFFAGRSDRRNTTVLVCFDICRRSPCLKPSSWDL